jgi:predicted ester cyclase
MASITEIAGKFFEACETGKGWEGCKEYCRADATFSAQAEPLPDVKNLQQYTDWMKGLLTFIPDGRYELRSFATDEQRQNVCAYGVFSGTHTGEGGPCPPTGKSMQTDYVYVMEFAGDKIRLSKSTNPSCPIFGPLCTGLNPANIGVMGDILGSKTRAKILARNRRFWTP